jgi:hypothetical protein
MDSKTYVPTPAEQAVLDYHRRHLQGKTFLQNPDGSLTTFKGTIVGTDRGETLIPTFWNGAIRDVPDALRMAIKSGIDFPVYKTPEEALAAERRLHELMEQDTKAYLATQPKRK